MQKSTIEVGKEAIQEFGFAHHVASGPARTFLAALAIRVRSFSEVVSEQERLLTRIVSLDERLGEWSIKILHGIANSRMCEV